MKNRKRWISIWLIFILTFVLVCSNVSVTFAADKPVYWLKVNAQANVVTVYKKVDNKWEPFRAMLCSTGTGKKGTTNATPTGTFYVKGRWDWGAMVDNVYARYCVHFYQDYLFHSVPYNKQYDKKSQPTKEFNKLGKDASHGCIRLSTMDAKWVYDNCGRGTKVTIYNSADPGPLGKPSGIKVSTARKTYWDPTDPDTKNPYYKIKKPVITVSNSKSLVVDKGASYALKSGVTAKDPNTFQDLTNLITVYDVKWYSKEKGAYIDKSFSTSRLGTYRVTYRVKYTYGGTTKKTVTIRVANLIDTPKVTASNDPVSGKIKLTWKPVSGASKYQIYRADSKNGNYKWMCTHTGTSYVNTYDAVPGRRYYYKVKAISAKSTEEDSVFSAIVYRICDLPAPVVTAENDTKTGRVRLTWEPVSGASKYQIYRADSKNGKYELMYTHTSTTYVNTYNAVPGNRYYYKVRAIHPTVGAESAFSATVDGLCNPPATVASESK